jgi:hypothetical protein
VDIAERLGLTTFQVSRIRRRFETGGVDGLADQPKPPVLGSPRIRA